jgi:hypothetical protein
VRLLPLPATLFSIKNNDSWIDGDSQIHVDSFWMVNIVKI